MKRSIKPSSFPIFFFLLLLQFSITSNANDTITTTQIIRDGDTLVSSAQIFELGFFSPGASRNRYVGIWYKNITAQTVVWVANREAPTTSGGVLTVNPQGQLIILDNNNKLVWSTNTSRNDDVQNPVVQLLDSGNLVIRDDRKYYLWQSFDYPTDTLLQGMRLGVNLVTGKQNYLTSWKSSEDPALGDYTMSLEVTGYPQIVTKRGDAVVYRTGPWNGVRIGGWPILRPNGSYTCEETLIMNSSVVYYNKSIPLMTKYTLTPSGVGQVVSWAKEGHDLIVSFKFPGDVCDNYGSCGAHGSCNTDNLRICGCLQRFVPRERERWAEFDWSGGCVRRAPLNCSNDVFLTYSGMKMPDARHTWYNESTSLGECKVLCLGNCSCTAYSNLNISGGGSGCLLWFGDLVDIKQISGETGEIYIRMAASELDFNGRKETILIAVLASLAGIVLLGLIFALLIWKRKKNDPNLTKQEGPKESNDEDLELPIYDISTLSKATDKFSNNNKLGEGGFGNVYKGMLDDGEEIAIKRLSKTSSQGVKEFKNEIICISKLQHRNLVKLLGCCIEGGEKMLIYEYMPNKSLDLILFDKTKGKQFDWPKRFLVVNGIARGLMYLHQDSRLRIIHRDLKASNILLDDDLNPKITDFGIARIFRGNEIEVNTKRVVGTYGYMSPEYAGYGLCSLKSDVYSFGVLVLEIVSGQRSVNFHHIDNDHHLLKHAWILYQEGRSLELVDPNIVNTVHVYELERLIHLALLCVQHHPEDRPIMSSVVLMLGGGGVLSEAKKPGFFTNSIWASNEYTITQLEGR